MTVNRTRYGSKFETGRKPSSPPTSLPDTTNKQRNKGGRPIKYREEYCSIAQAAAKQGSTDKQIAELFGVNVKSLKNWAEQHREFFLSLRDGRDEHNVNVAERSLVRLATGFECDETSEEHTYIKTGKGKEAEYLPARKVRRYHKVYAPNPTALIFLLVNRTKKDGRWQNVQNVQLSGPNGEPLKAITGSMNADDAAAIYMDMLKRGEGDFLHPSSKPSSLRHAGSTGRHKRV